MITDAIVASRKRSSSDGLREPAVPVPVLYETTVPSAAYDAPVAAITEVTTATRMPGTPIELAAAIAEQAAPMSAVELAGISGDVTVPTKRPTIMELPRFSDHGSPYPTVAMTALGDGVTIEALLADGADGDLAIAAMLDRGAVDPPPAGGPMTPAESRSLIATLLGVAPIAAPPPATAELPVVVASTRLIEPAPAPAAEVLVERAPSPAPAADDEGGADDLDLPVGLFPRWLGISLVAVALVVAFALLVVLVRFSP